MALKPLDYKSDDYVLTLQEGGHKKTVNRGGRILPVDDDNKLPDGTHVRGHELVTSVASVVGEASGTNLTFNISLNDKQGHREWKKDDTERFGRIIEDLREELERQGIRTKEPVIKENRTPNNMQYGVTVRLEQVVKQKVNQVKAFEIASRMLGELLPVRTAEAAATTRDETPVEADTARLRRIAADPVKRGVEIDAILGSDGDDMEKSAQLRALMNAAVAAAKTEKQQGGWARGRGGDPEGRDYPTEQYR